MKWFVFALFLLLSFGAWAQPSGQGVGPGPYLPSAASTSAQLGIFLPTNYGRITDGGYFGDGLAHPASANGYASLGALQAVYPFATATSNDMAGLMIQAAINANNVAGSGYVSLQNGSFRVLPAGIVFAADTNARLVGSGSGYTGNATTILCANAVAVFTPCVTVNEQLVKQGPIGNLSLWGMNTIQNGSGSAGGVAQTNIYNPGSVAMFFTANNEVNYQNLVIRNFDSALDWDTSTGNNYVIVFRDCWFYGNNRGISINHTAPNSFERMVFDGGGSSNNNYGAYIVLQGPITTISSGTYNSTTGAVSLTTAGSHGLSPGSNFSLSGVTGTGSFGVLDTTLVATSGTTGTTLNFTVASGLTMTITGGNLNAQGSASTYGADVHITNESVDYNFVNQVYYLGNGNGNDHSNSVYISSSHIETNTTNSGTGPRILHDGDMDFSQADFYENGSNANAAVEHIGFYARTWISGGKTPGYNYPDNSPMPFVGGGGSTNFVSGVGLDNRFTANATLANSSSGGGYVSGFQFGDGFFRTLNTINQTLSMQVMNGQGPIAITSSGTLTIPANSTEPFNTPSSVSVATVAGAKLTLAPAGGVTINGPTVIGGSQPTQATLTYQGSNTWGVAIQAGNSGTATAVSGAATLNTISGIVTSESLTAATTYTLTLADSLISSSSVVVVNATDSSSTAVTLTSVTPSSGQVVIVVGMTALTGTVKFAYQVNN
jgi:hypothetical protein